MILARKLLSILLTATISPETALAASSVTYLRLTATVSKVSVSINDERAMTEKLAKSFAVDRARPSAMFAGSETTALVNWLDSANLSLAGNRSARAETLATH